MATTTDFLWLFSKASLIVLALTLCSPSWGQGAAISDSDRATIARMDELQLAQGILNVRTDLKEYLKHDLTTTSGQYELLYDEVMGPCKRRNDPTQAYELCSGASIGMSFIDYLNSTRRICPDPQTGSCWKPALREHEMRDELMQLVRKSRGRLEQDRVAPALN